MWAKARAVGNAPALSTGRAGARQRIVHMSTARVRRRVRGVWGGEGAGTRLRSLPGVGAATLRIVAYACRLVVELSARRWARSDTSQAGPVPVQLRFVTGLTGDEYVTRELWRSASLAHCPLHPKGGCGFARHGFYERKTPAGTFIARWYCPRSHCTFSLLPDHLAARFPGTLAAIEQVVQAAHTRSASLQACANALRPDPVSLPSALRWLRRRLALVWPLLSLAVTLLGLPAAAAQGVDALREQLPLQTAQLCVLEQLRALLQPHLPVLTRPVGFGHRRRSGGQREETFQQWMGPD
jgi:hypothetical protein